MPVAVVLAFLPWLVGGARKVYDYVTSSTIRAVAKLDDAARAMLAQIGISPLAPITISSARVQQAAAAFRSVVPTMSDAMLRLVLAQTNLESSFGHGWGPGCWNMGAEQCPNGQPGPDYTCIDHEDEHADASTYTGQYKCF